MGEVQTQWDRLVSVLQQRGAHSTLAAIAPALPADQVAGVLNASGRALLSPFVFGDVSEWLSCHNGFRDGQWARLFPDLDLLNAAQIAQTWSTMLSAHPAPSGYPLYSGPPAYGFIRQYVPIAERDGYLWVVDGRPGETTHSVIAFDKVDADDDATTWPSIGSLLADVATAIDTGETFDGSTVRHRPSTTANWRGGEASVAVSDSIGPWSRAAPTTGVTPAVGHAMGRI